MTNSMIVNITAALGLINIIFVLVVIILPEWKINSRVASQPNLQFYTEKEGLWLRCSGYQHDFFSCDYYDSSLIGLDAYLNAFRAFMIIALIVSLAGVVCSALGMRCTTILAEEGKGKRYVVIAGGVCHIISGVLTGISVSWYAAEVVREYYSPYYRNQKMKYTLGACLYVGWVSMVFSLVCGCLMVCCTCFNKPADSKYYGYKTSISKEKSAIPPHTVIYQPAQPYKEKGFNQPEYYRSSSHYKNKRSYRSHRSDRSYPSNYRSSYSSNDRSPKSSRHDSDVMRASGFV